jgi:hypothetical protein
MEVAPVGVPAPFPPPISAASGGIICDAPGKFNEETEENPMKEHFEIGTPYHLRKNGRKKGMSYLRQ